MEITEEIQAEIDKAVSESKAEIAAMAAKNTELLTEVKSERKKKGELEEAKRLAEEKRAIENGEYKTISETKAKELEEERANNQSFRQQIELKDIKADSIGIASTLTKDAGRLELLTDKLKQYTTVSEGAVVYTVGGIVVDQTKVIEHIKEKFSCLVDGNPASGDGAKGGLGGSGGGAASFKDMSRTEKSLLQKNDPVKYKQLAGN